MTTRMMIMMILNLKISNPLRRNKRKVSLTQLLLPIMRILIQVKTMVNFSTSSPLGAQINK